MKKLFLTFLLSGAAAFAFPVSYSTEGVFSSTGTDSVSNGDATIKFIGDVTANVNTPTFSSLGTFLVTGDVGGNFTDHFTLTVSQTVPSAGGGTSVTTINGTITGNSSTILLTFVPSSFAIGAVNYEFSPDSYGLNNPEDNLGKTTIGAFLTSPQASTPEPGFLGLVGVSLLGLGMMVRRQHGCRR
jgi:hypothetical protein